MANIVVLHGPNLNLLGTREPAIYGSDTLASINAALESRAEHYGHQLSTLQSNHEGILIDRIQSCLHDATYFLSVNPGGFTYTSVALRDALLAAKLIFLEVHLSNLHAREDFRHHSFFSSIALGTISGRGANGYLLTLEHAHLLLKPSNS